MAGGFNTWLGAVGFGLFRASTRIGIFAHVWVLLFAGLWLTRQSRRLPRFASVLGAAVIALAACWEETPPLNDDPVVGARNLARWHLYENATARLERALPAGAAVFQLPAVPFPEAGPTRGMPDYEHALPFLTSHTLRFSYGHLRVAPARAWTRYVSHLPAADLAVGRAHLKFGMIDDEGWVYVNGKLAGESHNWSESPSFDVSKFLHAGDNTIAVAVNNINGSGGLSGYAWGENVGWINFSGGAMASPAQPARLDKAAARLRGYAWGENIGWVNLDDANMYVAFKCPADFNGNGTIEVQDIFDFLYAWFAQDALTDFNTTGAIEVQDIFDFLTEWFTGC